MKILRKFTTCIFLLALTSCGFSPMLKDINLNNINIKKIDFTGPSNLTYFLKNNLNLPINENLKKAYSLRIDILENTYSVTKNTAGITTEEEINVTVNLKIFDSDGKQIAADSISDKRIVSITNNITADDTVKRIEKENIIINLIQQINFAIRAKIISSQQ